MTRTVPKGPSRSSVAPLCLAIAALLVSTAWFAPGAAEARFSKAEGSVSVDVAWRYWNGLAPETVSRPDYNCDRGGVELLWLSDLGTAMARAYLWGCTDTPPEILLETATIRNLGDLHACGVIVHEYGHLLGFAHESRPKRIMSGAPSAGDSAPKGATWKRAWRLCERRL